MTRSERREKRAAEATALDEWKATRSAPPHGTGIPGERFWAVRSPGGDVRRLVISSPGDDPAWVLDPGWSVDEVSGMAFEILRGTGIPVVRKSAEGQER